jgi:hypothetical protein
MMPKLSRFFALSLFAAAAWSAIVISPATANHDVPPEAEIIDNVDAGFSVTGSEWTEVFQVNHWDGSAHKAKDIALPSEALIVDNDDANTTKKGTWSTGTNTAQYGSDYRYVDASATAGTRRFNWYPPHYNGGRL